MNSVIAAPISVIASEAKQSLFRRLLRQFVPRNDTKGFSLIEMIMTIVIVTIVSIPLALLIGEHARSLVQSSDMVTALNLARLEMGKLENAAYANITTSKFIRYEGYDYDVVRTVSFVQGNNSSAESLKKVVIDVMPTGTSTIEASLVTYFAKNIGYGV